MMHANGYLLARDAEPTWLVYATEVLSGGPIFDLGGPIFDLVAPFSIWWPHFLSDQDDGLPDVVSEGGAAAVVGAFANPHLGGAANVQGAFLGGGLEEAVEEDL